jgi:hypothetical protein
MVVRMVHQGLLLIFRAVARGEVAIGLYYHRGVKRRVVVDGGIETGVRTGVTDPPRLFTEAETVGLVDGTSADGWRSAHPRPRAPFPASPPPPLPLLSPPPSHPWAILRTIRPRLPILAPPTGSDETLHDPSAAVCSPALTAALGGYLRRNPRDAFQPASWLACTLWAFELVDGKPDRLEVAAALGALGGDRYRRELAARGAANGGVA